MQNDVNSPAGPTARVGIDYVGFQEFVPPPRPIADSPVHFVQVMPVAGLEVVDANHVLSEAQQDFDQMRTDEPGASGHQPAQRLGAESRHRRSHGFRLARGEGHHSLHTWTPRARSAAASALLFTSTYTPVGWSLAAKASTEYCS